MQGKSLVEQISSRNLRDQRQLLPSLFSALKKDALFSKLKKVYFFVIR